MIVAIDGGAATGKSAVGRRVADALGVPFVDSGLMYRAVTRLAAERGIDPADTAAVTELARAVDLKIDGERIWADGVDLTEGIFDVDSADALPRISAIPGVRDALVQQQRRLGRDGVVMAGRDIGTVVFPDADHKFFLTAGLDERVRRRAAQFEKRGEHVDREAMRREVEERDRADTERAVAPLRPAPDAIVVDTDNFSVEQVVELILGRIRKAAPGEKAPPSGEAARSAGGDRAAYAALRWLMRALTRTYLVGLFKVIGAENLPRSGPLIICPSHSATLDPPLVPAFTPRSDTWSMAKAEYFKGGLTEFFFRRYHSFPVVRHSADRTALRFSFDLLKAGHALIIYPEGTRVESGVLAHPEPGAGFIAQKAACPVIAVGLTGTRECLPKGARWPRRVPVSITFGKPFLVATRRPDGSRVSHQEAADAIMVQIAELLPPHQRGAFSDLQKHRERLAGVTKPLS